MTDQPPGGEQPPADVTRPSQPIVRPQQPGAQGPQQPAPQRRPDGPPPGGPGQRPGQAGPTALPPRQPGVGQAYGQAPPAPAQAPGRAEGRPPQHTGAYPIPGPGGPAPSRSRSGGRGLSAGILIGALVLGLVGGVGGAAGYSALVDDDSVFSSSSEEGEDGDGDTRISPGEFDTESGIDPLDLVSVNDIANAVLPAVVQINTPLPGGYSQGSGFVVSDDGEVLTNHHVIEGASRGEDIVITFYDGSFAKAEVVGSDPLLDVALLQIEDVPDDLTVSSFGSSDSSEVGQAVVAVGAPYGLQSTVTAGIISALDRPFLLEGGGFETVAYPAIQTDAAVNSGNSGGPLVNLRGEVIGINGAIELAQTERGYDAGFIGISYAIPIDQVHRVIDQIRDGEDVDHASLGVETETATVEDIVDGAAAVVELRSGGPADEAGLEEGDMIIQIGDLHVNSRTALRTSVLTFEPGEEVDVVYLDSSGDEQTVTVELGSDLDD